MICANYCTLSFPPPEALYLVAAFAVFLMAVFAVFYFTAYILCRFGDIPCLRKTRHTASSEALRCFAIVPPSQ
jgi:hypothetical protein